MFLLRWLLLGENKEIPKRKGSVIEGLRQRCEGGSYLESIHALVVSNHLHCLVYTMTHIKPLTHELSLAQAEIFS